MKALWNYFCVPLLLLHLVAAAGFIGWLYASGRLDGQRAKAVVAMFKPTIEQQQQLEAQAKADQDQAAVAQAELARLKEVAGGPVTVAERLATDQEDQEVAMQKITWLRRTVQDLTGRLESDKANLEKMKANLDAARVAFEKAAAARREQQQDQDFQVAVRMYEQLTPAQAKSMFLQLLDDGREQDVLNYLAAMQQRKSAAVLREFKSPKEITLATTLLQQLAHRGIKPLPDNQTAAATDGGAT